MSYRVGHRPLTSNGYAWLAAAADPLGKGTAPGRPMPADELAALAEAGAAHGVLPATLRNLRRFSAELGPSAIVSGHTAERSLATVLSELERRMVLVTGQTMLLDHHARRIAKAFAENALAASIVKGPVFSRRLYPHPSDRSFTDIDILVAPAVVGPIAETLHHLGFVPVPTSNRDALEHGEYKWVVPGNEAILVEIQTNLIHSPNLGRGIRLQYADLIAAGDGDTEDATALLLVAAVHGAAGHQFDRLQPAIDVLQAARGAAGRVDRVRLTRIARQLGATAAVQTALDLVAQLFDEPAAFEIANELSPAPWRRARRGLLSPAIVLRAQSWSAARDSWRRRAIREFFARVGKPAVLEQAI